MNNGTPIFRFSLLYAFGIFALGFVLGTIRTLVLVPRIGALAGVLIEIPIMLGGSFFYSRLLLGRLNARFSLPGLAAAGVLAFILLMVLEYCLGVFVLKQTAAVFLGNMATLPGGLGLAAQVAFGFIPLLHGKANAK